MMKKTFSLIIFFAVFLVTAVMAQTLQPEEQTMEAEVFLAKMEDKNKDQEERQLLAVADTDVGAARKVKESEFQLTAAELELFARLVHAEAAGEPYQGQVAVAATVLNRLRSKRFPNTLSGVIYQVESGRYQYSPVLDGRINLPAGESAKKAVKEALAGADPSGGATGFYNPAKTGNAWVRRQPVTTVIGSHVFFQY